MTSTAKVLNMEEKKKFEKIIHADIERAKTDLRMKRSEESSALVEEYEKSPTAQALLAKYRKARKEVEAIEKEMEAKYLRPNHNHDKTVEVEVRTSGYSGGGDWPTWRKFQDETSDKQEKMEDMKRTYTLKLFAGGEEIEKLFAELQNTLKSIAS